MKDISLPRFIGLVQPVADDLRVDGMPENAARYTLLQRPPRILLVATLRWPVAARLAIAFANMGCRVEAICPRQHPLTKTRAVARIHAYGTLQPLTSLRAAVEAAGPDLIIPCDDDAAVHLHELYVRTAATDPASNALRELIAVSLGTPESCTLATRRGQLMAAAIKFGVRVPETAVVATLQELDAWFAQHRFPGVIKADCTWGGQGVSVVRDLQEAQRIFKRMVTRPPLTNAAARMLLERDPSHLLNWLKQTRRSVTLQNFISGAPANRAVACWQGQVLAGISVQAFRTQHATGPATVVRVIENPEMSEAAHKLVRGLGISGLWGIDFVLESSSGTAFAIEMNPRATPICHLPLGPGCDLPAALYAQLTGAQPPTLPVTIDLDVIALFPGEWQRDSASPYLRSGYHDVPWNEIELIQDCIAKPWSERGLIARSWARMRPKLSQLRRPAASLNAESAATPNDALRDGVEL